jgi:hypothetical protein
MRAVSMPEPVRRYGLIDADRLRRAFHHAVDALLCEPASAITACEHGIIGAGVTA